MKGEVKIQPIANRIINEESDRTNGFMNFQNMLNHLKDEVPIDSYTKEELYDFYLDFRLHIALSLLEGYSNGDGIFLDTRKITLDKIQQADDVVHNLHVLSNAYLMSQQKLEDAIRTVAPYYQPKFEDVECNPFPDLSQTTLISVMRNLALSGDLELVLKKKEQ